jgi:hypothetical protein
VTIAGAADAAPDLTSPGEDDTHEGAVSEHHGDSLRPGQAAAPLTRIETITHGRVHRSVAISFNDIARWAVRQPGPGNGNQLRYDAFAESFARG